MPPCGVPAAPQEWLGDKRGRDQFVARYGDETEVCWNDAPKQQEETVYKRSFWTGARGLGGGSGVALPCSSRRGETTCWGCTAGVGSKEAWMGMRWQACGARRCCVLLPSPPRPAPDCPPLPLRAPQRRLWSGPRTAAC